jgi:hypothetical protein
VALLCLIPALAVADTASVLEIGMQGRVTDQEGKPLARTSVRVFADGMAIATSAADDSGTYSLDFETDGRDQTIVVFWNPGRANLVSEIALIAESEADRTLGLWNPCVPRIGLLRRLTYNPVIRDRSGLRERFDKTGCARHAGP